MSQMIRLIMALIGLAVVIGSLIYILIIAKSHDELKAFLKYHGINGVSQTMQDKHFKIVSLIMILGAIAMGIASTSF